MISKKNLMPPGPKRSVRPLALLYSYILSFKVNPLRLGYGDLQLVTVEPGLKEKRCIYYNNGVKPVQVKIIPQNDLLRSGSNSGTILRGGIQTR
jgi:hypothetical protein